MQPRSLAIVVRALVVLSICAVPISRADEAPPPADDILMRAMVDELQRSMTDLVLEDLPRPYFIQYSAEDRDTVDMRAAYGGLQRSERQRSRSIASRVRVGSYELDNTNIGRGFGGGGALPLDDDYTALRHAIWRMTDSDYKQAVEALTRKQAYLKQKTVEDRPDDFSAAEPVRDVEPYAELAFDQDEWQENLKRLSARFKNFPEIQDSHVTFFTGVVNEWIVNSEGTRLRTADTGVGIKVHAELQADEGMRLSDNLSYIGLQVADLPAIERIVADIDNMCAKLIALAKAPVLEHYAGPVLFTPPAAGRAFEALLTEGFCARPIPLGSGSWADTSLEKKIGLRILPRSFQVCDDPGLQRHGDVILAGSYTYDDEAVRPTRVPLVEKGVLKTLLASRAPTRKIKNSTGHGRGGRFGDAQATIGCLYFSDDEGMSEGELEQELIQAARDEGLEFGLWVESLEPGGRGSLGDPIYAYKVYAEDGHKELVRGVRFLPVETRSLKHILAGGTEQEVYNSAWGVPVSIIAPAVVFEELELTKIEQEFDKLPILKPPSQRSE